jgi:hypothetical protein
MKQFLGVFPQFSTPFAGTFDFANALPESVISDLLSKRETAAAYECSKAFGQEGYFLQRFIDLVAEMLRSRGDISSLFDGCELLCPIVYSKLPSELQRLRTLVPLLTIEPHLAEVRLSKMTDFEIYREFLTTYPFLDCDQGLFALVHQEISRSIDILLSLKWVAWELIRFFRQPQPAVDLVWTQVCRRIDQVTVDSMATEAECLYVLRRSFIVLEATKLRIYGFFDYEVQILQVNFLSRFASKRIWTKCQWTYSFKNFQDPNFLNSLIEICCRADMIDMLVDVNTIWSAYFPALKLQTLSTIIRLGSLDEVQTYLTTMSANDSEPPSDLGQVLDLLSYPIAAEVSFVPLDGPPGVAFMPDHVDFAPDRRLRVPSLHTRSATLLAERAELSQQQIRMRSELLGHLGEEGGQIVFDSRRGDFVAAFDLWRRLRPEERSFSMAVKYLLIPSISYSHWDSLWAYLKDNRPILTEFRPLLESLFEFCHPQGMKKSLISVDFALEM